jgi:nucleotide-binding universal stress UspA family protein
MFDKILVAFDGSDGANAALRAGIDLAGVLGVELHAVMVEDELPRYAGTIDEVDAIKEQKDAYFGQLGREACAVAASAGVKLQAEVIAGHEIGAIVEYVRSGEFDLLLIGWHGHSQLHERIMGSTAHGLMFNAPCSVLVVKQIPTGTH